MAAGQIEEGAATSRTAMDMLTREFGTLPELVRHHAARQPAALALVQGGRHLDYAALDRAMDRVAAALQRDGVRAGQLISICAATSLEYATTFLGALRAGVAVAPLAPGSTPETLAAMV